MNNLALNTTSMTLKEITDLLDVRHDKAMLKVAAMAEEPEFGWVSKMDIQYSSGKGRIDTIETYKLDKRQSIAVAAMLNTALLMRVIDRWQELESARVRMDDDQYAAMLISHGLLPGMKEWWGEVLKRGYLFDYDSLNTMVKQKPKTKELRFAFELWYCKRYGASACQWTPAQFKRSMLRLTDMFSLSHVCDALNCGYKFHGSCALLR